MTGLMCPLCSKSRFENLETLRGRLVEAATQNITCPICSEILLGLDKFTIHLFGHSLRETEPTQSTVNMDDLSFLTSWENCWKNQEPAKPEKPKEVINELFLEIKESYPDDKESSKPHFPTTMENNLLQELIDPSFQTKPKFDEMRRQSSPKLDSPPFLYEGDSSFILTPSPKTDDNDSSQTNNNEVRELSQYMAGFLSLNTIPEPDIGQRGKNITAIDERKEPRPKKEPLIDEKNTLAQPESILRPFPHSQFLVFPGHLIQQPDNIKSLAKNKSSVIKTDEQKKDPYCCKECGKSFRMRGSLVVHNRVAHGGKTLDGSSEPRNFHCNICSKAFKKEQHLAQHVKTHDGKQWQCETCEKFFTTKYFLKKHQRLHTGEMPYCCETCGKTFTFQQSYHKHLLYHSADKPHECRECGRSFKELSTLHNHQRIHSGEKPFACETCGKCFRQRVSYIVHQRIHTGVLPYQCTACLKKFRYKVSQRSHKCTVHPPGIVVRQPGDLIQRLLEQRRLLQCPQ